MDGADDLGGSLSPKFRPLIARGGGVTCSCALSVILGFSRSRRSSFSGGRLVLLGSAELTRWLPGRSDSEEDLSVRINLDIALSTFCFKDRLASSKRSSKRLGGAAEAEADICRLYFTGKHRNGLRLLPAGVGEREAACGPGRVVQKPELVAKKGAGEGMATAELVVSNEGACVAAALHGTCGVQDDRDVDTNEACGAM